MSVELYVGLAKEVAGILNGIIARLPTREQKKIEEFMKFETHYQEEVRSAESDTDYLITLRYRRNIVLNALVASLKATGKG